MNFINKDDVLVLPNQVKVERNYYTLHRQMPLVTTFQNLYFLHEEKGIGRHEELITGQHNLQSMVLKTYI